MSYKNRILNGFIIVFVFNLLASLSGYLTRIFLARTISPEQFGLFYSIYTLFMFITIFTDMGYNQALVKYVPEFVVSKNKQALAKIIRYVIFVNVILTVIISIIILFASGLISRGYLNMSGATNLILLGIAILVFNNVVGFMQVLFQAFQNMFKYGFMYFVSKILFFLCTVFLFYVGFSRDVRLPLVSYILSCIVVIALFGYSAYKLITPRFRNKYFDKEMFHKITRFALPNMISTIAGTVIGYIDTIILTPLVSLSLVGVYNATLSTILIFSYLGGVVAIILFPLISELSHKKKNKDMEQLIAIIYRYSLIIILPCALGVFFFSKTILFMLFGEAFVVGATAMSILAIGMIFLVIAQVNFAILNGLGKPKKITNITIVAAIFNTVGNIILIPYLGIDGSALITTLSYLIMMLWSYINVKQEMDIKVPKIPGIILSSIIFFASLYFLKSMIKMNIYAEIIVIGLISGCLYIALLFGLKVLTVEEVKNVIKKTTEK